MLCCIEGATCNMYAPLHGAVAVRRAPHLLPSFLFVTRIALPKEPLPSTLPRTKSSIDMVLLVSYAGQELRCRCRCC